MNIYRSVTKINIIAVLMSSSLSFGAEKSTPRDISQCHDSPAEMVLGHNVQKITKQERNFKALSAVWNTTDNSALRNLLTNDIKKEDFAYRYLVAKDFGFFMNLERIYKVQLLAQRISSSDSFSLLETMKFLKIKGIFAGIVNERLESITPVVGDTSDDDYKLFQEFLSTAIILRKRKAFESLVTKDICGCLNYVDDNSLEIREKQNANKINQDLLRHIPSRDIHPRSRALFDQWEKEACITKSTTLDWINHWVEKGDFDSYYAETYKRLGGKTYAELSSAK